MVAIFPVKIHIEDTDYGGVVYHANYLKFYERARSEWANELGFGHDWQQKMRCFFPVRFAKIDYLKPARLGDALEVVSEIKEIRRASLVFFQRLRQATSKATIVSEAEIKVAYVDAELKPQPLPQFIKDLLTGRPDL